MVKKLCDVIDDDGKKKKTPFEVDCKRHRIAIKRIGVMMRTEREKDRKLLW